MRIKVLKGKLEGHSFEIDSDNLLIGHASDSDIQIPDPSISRRHAKIFKSGDKYFIKDLKSCNGTWVDGCLIWPGNEIELRQGLQVSIGDTLLTLDNFDSDKGSSFSYSIDLTSVKEHGSMNLLFKDRRIANRKNLELICEISEVLLRPLELDVLCEKILYYIFYYLKRINKCAILMLDKNSNNIYILKDKARDLQTKGELNYSRRIVRQVLNEVQALMIRDQDFEEETGPSESRERICFRSVMCVPLISNRDITGVIYAHSVDEPNTFRRDDLYTLVTLSSYVSAAIENATQHALKDKTRQDIDMQVILRHKLETIKNLAGVISHELNNLLMCIQGETSLLLYDIPKEDTNYARMRRIEKYIEKGTELSTLICGFPVAPLHLNACYDLNRLVADSVNKFAHLPDSTFQLESAPDLWPVDIDERQIMHALTNVCSFFLTANKNQHIINIRCENVIPDRHEITGLEGKRIVRISMGENNNYMDKNELIEIFSPGFSLEKGAGSNISAGLISAYWIIEKNMGRLVVTSDREKGTEFRIYLPALAERQAEERQAEAF